MPSITVTTNEINASGGNVGVTGTAFIAAATDQGPVSGPAYVACRSINDYTFNFGARSTTSAAAYDWLDEYFHDGGQLAYVTRNAGNAAAAALTLNDAGSNPSVVVTASPGVNGNALNVVVARKNNPTFTMTTVSSSTACSAVSSFANIGVGTPVTGTGIAANTYVAAVNVAAGTLTLSANATASNSGVTITPAAFTITIETAAAAVLETHGPYITTAQLYADLTSTLVVFSQSAGGGFTTYVPAALTITALAGGTNSSNLTSATAVSALANFTANLGPGQVALPGYSDSTAWAGLLAHAAAKNRFAILDLPDNATAASVISGFGSIAINATYGMAIEGSLTLPGITPNTTRTCAGSAAVAALRAQVGATANQNQNPSGNQWPISYPLAFTTFWGPGGTYSEADVNSMSSAGINCFAIYQGVPCLFGFVTPALFTNDVIFWQATATAERMALVFDGTAAISPFLFETFTADNKVIIACKAALKAMCATHQGNGAILAFAVNMDPPINTPTTEEAGQLNANLQVQIGPYVNTILETITTVPITVPVV